MCDCIICMAVSKAAFAHAPVCSKTQVRMQESADRRREWRVSKPSRSKNAQTAAWLDADKPNVPFEYRELYRKLRLGIIPPL